MLDLGGQAGSASQDLGSVVGSMLGELGSETAPEEQDAGTEAGAPPADAPPVAPETSPTPVVAPDAEPPAKSVPATPATPDIAAVAEVDPLSDSAPLKYTVNGQERSVEGIRILGDEAIITKDALPDIVRRLGERDNLFEQSQQFHQRQQETESLAAWKHTAPDGSESMLTGNAGLVEMRVSHARLEAALGTMISALQDPNRLPQMVALDDTGNIVLNNTFIQTLLTESELSEIKAEQETRGLIGQLQHAATQAAIPPTDFSQFAPAIIKQASGDQFTALSPTDQKSLGQQMLRYIRPTTPEERRNGHGVHIVDATFTDVVQQWVGLRSEGAQAVKVAATASVSNAARLAAARRGSSQPTARPTLVPSTPTAPGDTDQDRAWAARERAAAGRNSRR